MERVVGWSGSLVWARTATIGSNVHDRIEYFDGVKKLKIRSFYARKLMMLIAHYKDQE